jgi:hypothetical protein
MEGILGGWKLVWPGDPGNGMMGSNDSPSREKEMPTICGCGKRIGRALGFLPLAV